MRLLKGTERRAINHSSAGVLQIWQYMITFLAFDIPNNDNWYAGATGLVGSRLAHKLTTQGATVRVLTRDVSRAKSVLPYARIQFFGPSEWATAIQGCTGVVNLAGTLGNLGT